MIRFLLLCLVSIALSACVQTVEPSAQDQLLMQAQENVATMPEG